MEMRARQSRVTFFTMARRGPEASDLHEVFGPQCPSNQPIETDATNACEHQASGGTYRMGETPATPPPRPIDRDGCGQCSSTSSAPQRSGPPPTARRPPPAPRPLHGTAITGEGS